MARAHEGGLRPGTENTPSIVALGHASHLAAKGLDDAKVQMTNLRDRLADQLSESISGLVIHGGGADRLPNTLSVSFPGVSGYDVLQRVPEICASTGSACHSDGVSMSATLTAMGCRPEQQRGTVRLSLGWHTSQEEIDRASNLLIDAWENLAGTPEH